MQKLKVGSKLVFTGPESSGKTTLAVALAKQLDSPLVPEFARTYLNYLGREYVYGDLLYIAAGQRAWENHIARNHPGQILICDTDWTVIRIWEQYKFGTAAFTQPDQPDDHTFYFLCAPDIPWAPDPLREHPEERQVLFTHYLSLLQQTNAAFCVLEGDLERRLETIRRIITKLS